MPTVGQPRGHRWHQARLLVTEHSENGPLEVLQWLQESFERRLILLAQPATAKRQSRRQLANAPNLWLTALRCQAIEGDDQTALRLGNLGQSVSLLPLVAGQQGGVGGLIKMAHMGCGDGEL